MGHHAWLLLNVYNTNDRSKRNRRTGQADHALVVNGKTVEVVSQVGHRYFGTMVIMTSRMSADSNEINRRSVITTKAMVSLVKS